MRKEFIRVVFPVMAISFGLQASAGINDYLRGDTGAASSTFNTSYPPSEAFDGNDSGDNANMWHSSSSTGPHYLRSDDLGANVPFTFIRTVGRDILPNRIIGMYVGVFTNSAPTLVDVGSAVWSNEITQLDQTFIIPFGTVTGRTVMVYGTPVEGWANIAEVIAGYEYNHNLAAGTSPSQSSQYSSVASWGPQRAVDENTGTYMHTNNDPGNHWWKSDLGANLPIEMIRLDGRPGEVDRLNGLSVMLYDTADATGTPVYSNLIDSITESTLTQYFPLPTGTTARSVMIFGNPPTDTYMNMGECWVFGGNPGPYPEEAMIQPVGVSGKSYYGLNQHYDNVINGSGLYVKGYTHGNGSQAQGMWHAGGGYSQTGTGVTDDQEFVFTLPGTYTLTEAYFWAHNQLGATDRSIRQYDLSVSSDGITYTQILTNAETAQAGGTIDETFQTKSFDAAAGDVRFVKLGIDTDWAGAASHYVGLSEIRFGGTMTEAGPVIENSFATTGPGLSMPPVTNDVLKGVLAVSSLGIVDGSLDLLTDGEGSSDYAHRVVPGNTATPWTLTFGLKGMRSIDRINVYTFNTDNRRNADFDVEYSTDNGSTYHYLFIGANNYPTSANVSLTTLFMEDGSALFTDATNLRLTLRPVNGGVQHSSIIEVDAYGPALPAGTLILIN